MRMVLDKMFLAEDSGKNGCLLVFGKIDIAESKLNIPQKS